MHRAEMQRTSLKKQTSKNSAKCIQFKHKIKMLAILESVEIQKRIAEICNLLQLDFFLSAVGTKLLRRRSFSSLVITG